MWGRLRRAAIKKTRPAPVRLWMEALEDRTVPDAFTPGNLAVLVADGAVSNTTFSIVEVDPASPTQSNIIAISGTGANAMRLSGSATSTGYLSLTNDGTLLTFNAANSTDTSANVNTLNPRAVGTLNPNGDFAIATTYTGTSGNQTRSSTSLNNTTWFIADQGGLYTNNATAADPVGNFRAIRSFDGVVYTGRTSSTTTTIQVATISAATGGTVTGLPGLTNNASHQDFYMIRSGDNGSTYDVLYILSATSNTAGTIAKYSFVDTDSNGSLDTWTANGTYTTSFGGFGLTAKDNGNGAILYATSGQGALTANSIVKLSDTAGYNSTISITTADNVIVYNAPTGKIAKGVSFVPVAANSPPVVTTSSGSTSYTENAAPVAIDANVTVTDDGANLTGATIQITSGYINGQDVLAFTNTSTITGTFNASTGTLTLSGTDTVANYQTALRTVTYSNTSDDPSTADRTVAFIANDGALTSAGANKTVTVTAVNDAPTLTATPTNPTFTENAAAVGLFSGAAVGTIEAGQNIDLITLTVSSILSTGSEFLFIDGSSVALTNGNSVTTATNGLTVSVTIDPPVPGGTATVTISKTGGVSPAAVTTLVNELTYVNTSDDPINVDRRVTLTSVRDTGGTTGGGQNTTALSILSTVTVVAVNDAPINAVPGTQTTPEDTPLVFSTTNGNAISVSDPDLAEGALEVTLTATNGTVTLSTIDNLTFSAGDGTADVTMTFSGSVPSINAALNGLTFAPAPNFNGTAGLRIITSDGGNTGTGGPQTDDDTITVTVTSVNDAPVVTTSSGSTSYTENAAPVAVDANVTVTDDGANLTGATVQITSGYVNGQDVLAFTSTATITGTFDASSGTLTLSGTDTVANYQAALRTVTYVNTSSTPSTGDRTVTFTATDGTDTSAGANKTVTVAAVNNAPVVTTSAGSTSYTENGAPTAVDANVMVSDADSANLTGATIQIAGGYVTGQDVLAFTNTSTITGTFDASSGTLTLGGTDTVANYQSALRSVTYSNTSDNPATADRTVIFIVTDGIDFSAGANKTVTVTAVNDAPVVTTSSGSTSYAENGAPIAVDGNVSVSDADNTNLTGATVQITSNYVNGQDVLAFTNTATITGTFDASSGTLTLSGTDTVANYQLALRAVTYTNTSDDPSTADRTVTFIANDGTDFSTGANKTVTVTAVNDAPTLTATPTNPTFTENGAAVGLFTGTAVSTIEAGQNIDRITLTVSNVTDGASELLSADGTAVALTNGTSVTTAANGLTVGVAVAGSIATVTISKAGGVSTAVAASVVNGLAYQNTSDAPGTASRSATLTSVRDTGGGSDTTALSIASTVTVVAVNDAPILTGANNLSAINEDPASNSGTLVSGLISGQVTDPDGPFSGIAITSTVTANGSWEYTVNGTTWKPVGSVSGTSALLLAADANTRVRFVPNANFNGTVTNGLTFRAWDQSTDTAESLVDVSTNGGTTAFSSATASTGITVNSVNDAPAGADKTVTTNEDVAYTFTTADFGFTDPNDTPVNTLAAVKITTLPAAGTLTNTGTAVTAGQFVSAADIAAGQFRFAPVADASGTGYASFTFQVQDNGGTANGGANLDPSPNTVTVNVTAVNDAPTLTDPADLTVQIAVSQTVNLTGITAGGGETQGLSVTAASDNTAVVPNPTVSYLSPSATGSLSFTPTANGSATITVRVTDDNGTPADPTDDAFFEQTFLVTVPANVPPVNTAPASVSTAEDTAFAFTGANTISVTDPDNSAGNLTVVISIPVGRGALSSTAGSGSSVTFVGTAAAVNAALATLVYTPPADANNATFGGPIALTVSTTDGLGANDTDTAAVNVTAVNDAPSFTIAGNPPTVNEDAGPQSVTGFATNIVAGPATATDETGQTLTFVVTNNTNAALFSSGPTISAGGTLTYTAAANASGSATISVVLMDNGGGTDTSSPQTFTISVTAVNDAPAGTSGTVAPTEDTTYTFTTANFGFTDPSDAPANALAVVRIASLPAVGLLTNGGPVAVGQFVSAADIAAGNLRYTPAPNGAGTGYASFTFQVQDNGGTANGGANLDPSPNTVTINVAPINDAPTLTLAAPAVLVLQNSGSYTQDNFATSTPGGGPDEAGQTITYTVFNTNNALFSVQPAVSPTGTLTFTPAPGASGAVTVTVVAVDSGPGGLGGVNSSAPQSFSLTVSSLNPPSRTSAPLSVGIGTQLVALGTDAGTPGRVTVIDATTGTVVRDFFPFGGFAGGVRPAIADMNGDGTEDIVVATASQFGLVAVFDGATGGLLSAYLPFGPFPSGLQVAAGDLDGDGRKDLVLGLDSGAPLVVAINGRTGAVMRVINAVPGFAGGVRLALGDVTGDNRPDIVTVAGPGGNGLVVAYDGTTGAVARAFFAYPGLAGDISLAVGDVTGDGLADIVAGIQVPGGTFVGAFAPTGQLARGYFAPTVPANPAVGPQTGRVSLADVTGDRVADLLVGSPPNTFGTALFVVNGATGAVIDRLLAFNQGAFNPLFGSGVFVRTN